jgi:hypothetical protein
LFIARIAGNSTGLPQFETLFQPNDYGAPLIADFSSTSDVVNWINRYGNNPNDSVTLGLGSYSNNPAVTHSFSFDPTSAQSGIPEPGTWM